MFSKRRIKGKRFCLNALIEFIPINVELFLKGGREKRRFKMLSSTIVTWNVDIP